MYHHVQAACQGAAQVIPRQANSNGFVQEASQAVPQQEQGDSLDVILVVSQLPEASPSVTLLAAGCDHTWPAKLSHFYSCLKLAPAWRALPLL